MDAQRDDRGAEFPQHRRGHAIGRAVGAIQHDLQSVQPQSTREAGLGDLDIAPAGVFHAGGAAEFARAGHLGAEIGAHHRLDAVFSLVGQLEAVRAEQLDAVVLERIVRCGDHDADIGAQAAGQHGNRRRGQRTDDGDVHAGGDEARRQRRFDQIAGQARVLADQHAMAMRTTGEQQPSGLAEA